MSHREAVSMVTDHRDACQAAGRPSAVWWPLSADGGNGGEEINKAS